MTPPKRPPPPSPVRQSATGRPAAPPRGDREAHAKTVEETGGGSSSPLLLWVGISVGLASVLLVGSVIFFVTRKPPTEVANVMPPETPSGTTGAATEPPQPVPMPASGNVGAGEEINPQVPEATPRAPAEQPAEKPQPVPQPPATAPMPAVVPPMSSPMPMPPPMTPMVATNPATPARAPPATPTPGPALDDVRMRNKRLAIPESKDTKRHVIARVQVVKPQDCELSLVGTEDVCPAGTTLKLVSQDPAADERIWNVTVKSGGALSKERTIADFRLKGDELSFQWQRAAGGGLPALMFCLLQINAAGEQELCHLCKPLTAAPTPLKLAERWTVEAELPGDSVVSASSLRVEPLAIDFPNVAQPGNATLAAGETAIFKVTAASSGSLDVELELECRYEVKEGKLLLVIVPYAAAPNVARGDRPPLRAIVSPATIKRRKGELTKRVKELESQVKSHKSQLDRLQREEKSLQGVATTNVNQRNALLQQQLQIRQQINAVEPKLEDAETQQEAVADAAAWHSDMSALLDQLQMQAKFGFRIFRNVGNERVVIAEPSSTP